MIDPAVSIADSPAPPSSKAREGCRHCGQILLHETFRNPEGDAFCCHGCLQVYSLLGSQGWGRYYELLDQVGKQAPQAFPGADYRAYLAGLEEPGHLAGIGRWNGSRHALTLESGDITCAACGWLLENLLREDPGVRSFEVDFLHGEVFLDYDADVSPLKTILSKLAAFGYRLRCKPGISSDPRPPDRALIYRLAVSGACFVNAMAFSTAVYLGAFRGMSPGWTTAFGALGFALSVPAVAYCAHPFFSGALRALRGGRFNIDVTVSIGILLSFLVSAASVLGGAGTRNFSDSLTGLIFFLLLGRWGVRHFEAGLALKGRWFEALRPGRIRVNRGGASEMSDCRDVREGDIVEVLGGEYAPLDGVLETDQALMDTGLLTGESKPARLRKGDPVFAGYLNLKKRAALRVLGAYGTTRIARLGGELEKLASGRRALPDGSGTVAKWFTLIVAAFACGAFVLNFHEGLVKALSGTASVFIISCSCALALAVPISRGLGLKRAQIMGFHFRAQAALEALKDIRCVLFDKTGTLTFTRRTVSAWDWQAPWGHGAVGDVEALRLIKTLVNHSLHPVSISISRALDTLDEGNRTFSRIHEILHFGLVGRLDGAEDAPGGSIREVCLCRYGAWKENPDAFSSLSYDIPDLPANPAGMGYPDSCVFLNGRLAALIRFTDEIKPDVRGLIQALKRRNVAVALLSGDNFEKVETFARTCGIEDFHSGLNPEEKKFWAGYYRSVHGNCLAVGDGFNDSLLFGVSDLAMAVQGGAVDLSPGTDILFTGGRPSDLDRLFALSKAVARSVKASFWISGIYNTAAIAAAMTGKVTPLLAAVLMPLSSLSLCLAAYLCIPGNNRDRSSH